MSFLPFRDIKLTSIELVPTGIVLCSSKPTSVSLFENYSISASILLITNLSVVHTLCFILQLYCPDTDNNDVLAYDMQGVLC